MDKSTLSNYGWIVIACLVLCVMIALASPFGHFVEDGVKSTVQGLFDVHQNTVSILGIDLPNQEISTPEVTTTKTNITATFGGSNIIYQVENTDAQTLYDFLYEEYETDNVNNLKLPPTEAIYQTYDVLGCYVSNGKLQNLKNVKLKNGMTYNFTMPLLISDTIITKASAYDEHFGDIPDVLVKNNIPHSAVVMQVFMGGQLMDFCTIFDNGDTYLDLFTEKNPLIFGDIYKIIDNKIVISNQKDVFYFIDNANNIVDLTKNIDFTPLKFCYETSTSMSFEEIEETILALLEQDVKNSTLKFGIPYIIDDNNIVFYQDGTVIVYDNSDTFVLFVNAYYENGNIVVVDGDSNAVTFEVADDGSYIKENGGTFYLSNMTNEIQKNKKYSMIDIEKTSLIFNNDGSIDVLVNDEFYNKFSADNITYYNDMIYIDIDGTTANAITIRKSIDRLIVGDQSNCLILKPET